MNGEGRTQRGGRVPMNDFGEAAMTKKRESFASAATPRILLSWPWKAWRSDIIRS